MATKTFSIMETDPAEEQTFTANTAVNEVTISAAAVNGALMQGDSGASLFAAKDQPVFTEIGIRLPFSFCKGSSYALVAIWARSEDTLQTRVLFFNKIPLVGEPVSLLTPQAPGVFIPYPENFTAPFQRYTLGFKISVLNISMVNVPASLNATVQNVSGWLKVVHSVDLGV